MSDAYQVLEDMKARVSRKLCADIFGDPDFDPKNYTVAAYVAELRAAGALVVPYGDSYYVETIGVDWPALQLAMSKFSIIGLNNDDVAAFLSAEGGAA